MDAPPLTIDFYYTPAPLPSSRTPDRTDRLRDLLSPAELARAERFHFAADRTSYIAAHALKRVVLAAKLGVEPAEIEFQTNRYEKPFVISPTPIHVSFNISHTRGMVCLSIGPLGELGTDVEPRSRSLTDGLLQRIATGRELTFLKSLPIEERAMRQIQLWTLKEAYVKAKGTGLSTPLESISIVSFDDPIQVDFVSPNLDLPDAWRFFSFQLNSGYQAAVAANCSSGIGRSFSDIVLTVHPPVSLVQLAESGGGFER